MYFNDAYPRGDAIAHVNATRQYCITPARGFSVSDFATSVALDDDINQLLRYEANKCALIAIQQFSVTGQSHFTPPGYLVFVSFSCNKPHLIKAV